MKTGIIILFLHFFPFLNLSAQSSLLLDGFIKHAIPGINTIIQDGNILYIKCFNPIAKTSEIKQMDLETQKITDGSLPFHPQLQDWHIADERIVIMYSFRHNTIVKWGKKISGGSIAWADSLRFNHEIYQSIHPYKEGRIVILAEISYGKHAGLLIDLESLAYHPAVPEVMYAETHNYHISRITKNVWHEKAGFVRISGYSPYLYYYDNAGRHIETVNLKKILPGLLGHAVVNPDSIRVKSPILGGGAYDSRLRLWISIRKPGQPSSCYLAVLKDKAVEKLYYLQGYSFNRIIIDDDRGLFMATGKDALFIKPLETF